MCKEDIPELTAALHQSRFLTRNTFMSIMDERTISGEYLVDGVRYLRQLVSLTSDLSLRLKLNTESTRLRKSLTRVARLA